MEITLQLLLYFLRDLHPVVIKQSKKDSFFFGTHQLFLSEHTYKVKPDLYQTKNYRYLYVADLSELLAMKEMLSQDMTVLVSKNCECSADRLKELPCGMITVSETYKVPYLINRMINIFHCLTSWDKNMHIAALEGKSVQDLLDFSESILEHPTIIFDTAFNVLAYTKNLSCEYTNYQETIRNGYTDTQTMNLVREHHIVSRLEKCERLVAPAVGNESLSNIYLAFRGDKNTLGYACIFLNSETMAHGYPDLLNIFVSNMTFCLKRDFDHQQFGKMIYETFLRNLMNPAALSSEQVSEQIKNVEGLSEYGRFFLGVLEFEDPENVPLPFLARQIDQEMWSIKPFIYENQICMLRISDSGKNDLQIISDQETDRIRNLLQTYSYTLGISNEFCHITDLPAAFRQAKATIKFGKTDGKDICLYLDYYYFDLFQIMEQQMPIEHLKMGLYKKLQEYDHQHNTRYVRLILTYLKCDCNATHAAETLFLHRNTIRKAVQFVETTWHVNLNDIEVKKRMVIGELADQYLASQTPSSSA